MSVADDHCQLTISSKDGKKSGNISSLGYPNSYPEGSNCHYTFVSEGNERVMIIFYEFNLYLSAAREPFLNGTMKRYTWRLSNIGGHEELLQMRREV